MIQHKILPKLTLLCIFYVQTHAKSIQGIIENEHSSEPLQKAPPGTLAVGVVINAMHASNSSITYKYSLQSLQDLNEVRQNLNNFHKNIEITIIRNHSTPIVLYLERNSLLITNNFVRKYFTSSGAPIMKTTDEHDVTLSDCYFTGHVLKHVNSLVSLNICNGVKGVVELSDQVYVINPVVVGSKLIHYWHMQNETNTSESSMKCGTTVEDDYNRHMQSNFSAHRHKGRFPRQIKLPANHVSETRYIEMYVVMDNSEYRRAGSVDATVMRAVNIINYVSALYRQLNIYIALVGVEVWNNGDKIPYTTSSKSGLDTGKLLAEFNKYRQYKINWNVNNDNAQLFTTLEFEGNLIGKGSTKAICSQPYSGGITFDEQEVNYIRAATTMAHELGHNLGMIHSDDFDEDRCQCEDPKNPEFTDCIMHSSSSAYRQSVRWSQCNKENLWRDFTEGNFDHCLKNVPEVLEKVGNTAICGNFFVEAGEECDCGQPADCLSKCCDPTTCRLRSNATCATGSCCDLETCTVRPISYPCRPVQDSQCDLPETCDGDSEWCPIDTYKRDGTECTNVEQGYCYEGKCNTHSSQCSFVWGGESAKKADDFCYTTFNNRSAYYGNCGWKTQQVESDTPIVKEEYQTCEKEEDKFCGLLQCQGTPLDRTKIINFPLFIYHHTRQGKDCAVAAFDVGFNVYDPGQVPNGAKCSTNSMCINSKCVPVPQKPESCDCNGKGVCNQLNQCHCDIGWAPPDCKRKGKGGSITSHPMVIDGPNLALMSGLISFFSIALMVIVAVVIGCKRKAHLEKFFNKLKSRSESTKKETQLRDVPAPVLRQNDSQISRPPFVVKKHSALKPPSTAASSNNRSVISTPVFQSSTNGSSQMLASTALTPPSTAPTPPRVVPPAIQSLTTDPASVHSSNALKPSRVAPPPPKPAGRNVKNLGMLYENVAPAVPPKPPVGAKPPPPPKPALKPNPNRSWK